MESAELKLVTRNISNEFGGVVGNIRKTANDNQKMFSSILKDLGRHFDAQSAGMEAVSDSVENSSNKVASKIDATNNLLQDQLSLFSNLNAEMRNLNGSVRSLNNNITNNNQSLLTGMLGGLKGLQNAIIATAMSAAPGMLGLAGGIGGGLISDLMGDGKGGGVGQKISNPVMAKDIYSYLTQKGVDHEHAVGILANIQNESQFNSGAIGDNGTSGGLFQHHNERFTAMRKAAGPDWQKNWKGQVDYALSEGDMQSYLKRPVRSGQEAARAFVYDFERPKDKEGEANKRAANVGNVEKLVAGGVQSHSSTPSTSTPSSGSTTTPAATPVQKPTATEVGHAGGEHSGHEHEGIITGKHNQAEQISSGSAKEFLQSRGGSQSGAVGVNAEKLDGNFAEKMAKAIQAAEQATGSRVTITEGYRDPHVQAQYYSDYIGKPITYDGQTYQPNPAKLGRLAAPPGRSKHQKGMAVDIGEGPAREWLIQNAPKFGIESLFAKIGKDKPHFQMPGAGEGEGQTSGATPYSEGTQVTPGSGSVGGDRLSQINQIMQNLGGGVPGTEQSSGGIPDLGMGIPAHGGLGIVGINALVKGMESNLMQQMSGSVPEAPPAPPVASMVPNPTTTMSTQAIEQSQIESNIDDHTYKQNLKAFTEQTKKQTTEIAASEASSGTPVSYDYNNASDIGWPDWAGMIGGNHWAELKKIRLNMWG